MIKAVIFDCDGLLIDTETTWYYANKEVYDKYNVELPISLYAKCIGNPNFDDFHPYEYLKEQASLELEIEEIRRQAKLVHQELMKVQQLRPGVVGYLEEAKQLGLKIGLASSSPLQWIKEHLSKFDILDYFDVVKTGDMVKRVKPYPDVYEEALKQLGVQKEETIAFEDSVNGLKSAKAAGIPCVVVPNEATSYLTFSGHHLRLTSMEELSLTEVINEIKRNNK